jgi:nucleoside-diphosphate-sugar epimerase
MAKALGKPSRLIPIPSRLLIVGATLLGKQDMARRLCGSLQVDISHTKNTLGWKPPMSVDEALKKTAGAYLRQRHDSGFK